MSQTTYFLGTLLLYWLLPSDRHLKKWRSILEKVIVTWKKKFSVKTFEIAQIAKIKWKKKFQNFSSDVTIVLEVTVTSNDSYHLLVTSQVTVTSLKWPTFLRSDDQMVVANDLILLPDTF